MQVILADNLSKKFILANKRPASVSEGFQRFIKRNHGDEFWALKDISFSIEQREAVGIVGANGVGKSTLLKLITGILKPTSGKIRYRGRISSLIEVGAGFHPEMTGRENIYLNGSILGMKHNEISAKFDEIVAFAELERFIDVPVKRYSSGMYARLGFSIAAHVDPEILIVDEVLSVGDAAFQRKCLQKMDSIKNNNNTTVLFVSHNLFAIQRLCERAIWIDKGILRMDGSSSSVTAAYSGMNSDQITERIWDNPEDMPGNDELRISRVCIKSVDINSSEIFTTETPLELEFNFTNLIPDNILNIGLHFYNEDGVVIFTSPAEEPVWFCKPMPVGSYKSICRIPGNLLNDGMISVQLMVVKNRSASIFTLDNALVFNVADSAYREGRYMGKWIGAVRPILEWSTSIIETD